MIRPSNHAEVQPGFINGKWQIHMTPDRVEFHAKRPGWEIERIDSCAELMESGMAVWDCGAESGDFTALYHLFVGPKGKVVPIEPSPPYWPSIRAHWEANDLPPLQHWFPGFISDTTQITPELQDEGYVSVTTFDDFGWPMASLGPVIPDFGFRHLAQQAHYTPQVTIDDLVMVTHSLPDVIVLDIEGAEYRALRGAMRTLRELKPIMYVSVHRPIMLDWYGVTLDHILDLMRSVDYTFERLGEGTEEYFLGRPRSTK